MDFNSLINENENSEKLQYLLKKIKKIEIDQDLFSTSSELIDSDEIKILVEWGNILASLESIDCKKKALSIATTLPYISDSKSIIIGCLLILRKLGNYPAINLVEKMKKIQEYKNLLGALPLLENYILEILNSEIIFDKEYLLTNFQKKVYSLVKKSNGVSVSAPTSSGKSFIFIRIILNLVNCEKGTTAIYIVPTRALIRQVMNDFMDNISELGLKNIYIGCTSEIENLLSYANRSNILVLTQERLFQLCTKKNISLLKTKMIVIDEAHNIEGDGRGVLLEGALKYAQSIWPNVKMLFSSPLISNPEKLLETFELEKDAFDVDTFPLVRQNILIINRLAGNLVVSTKFNNQEIEIVRKPFPYYDDSKAILLAKVTTVLWNKQSTIIYANEPMLSTDIVRELVNCGEFPLLNDERLNEFSDFIEEHLSEKYELADFIRRGLAFHFGALPAIIRAGIEDLFKIGAIKIISCTSTLLEGLNMPAKNIFMFKPEKGKNKAIDSLNFWNLAGRAGRMGNDLVGNIICIEPDCWKQNPLNQPRLKTLSVASEKRITDESEKIRDYIFDREKSSGIDEYNEQLESMIIRERIKDQKLSESKYANDMNKLILNDIDNIVGNIINDFQAPLELITNCPGIIPDRINDLWKFFNEKRNSYETLLPKHPFDNGKDRFKHIVTIINDIFLNKNKWNERQINKIALVGYKWMNGVPLSRIIFYDKEILEKDARHITKHVQKEIEFLNDTIRFQVVKYTQVYINVLTAYLNSREKKEEAESIVNISSYLEYGSCYIPALEFMAIGLPREAAIKLSELIPYRPIFTTEYCYEWLKSINLDSITMSSYLKRQIYNVQKIL